jgi:catechol 2,3-dioxygenase-like lactoylglutathione lyase family enzyme
MTDQPLVVSSFNVVVTDMARSRAFYEALGLTFDDGGDKWGNYHLSCKMPGFDLDLDTVEFAKQWNEGSSGSGGGMGVLGFSVPTRDAVDAIYAAMIEAGHTGQQPPYDAFWGARYAVLQDPDGYAVGLMSPMSAEHRSEMPRPS